MKRPCILIVTACLLGELLGYYFSILCLVVAVIIVTASMVCFILRFQKNILSKLNKIRRLRNAKSHINTTLFCY